MQILKKLQIILLKTLNNSDILPNAYTVLSNDIEYPYIHLHAFGVRNIHCNFDIAYKCSFKIEVYTHQENYADCLQIMQEVSNHLQKRDLLERLQAQNVDANELVLQFQDIKQVVDERGCRGGLEFVLYASENI